MGRSRRRPRRRRRRRPSGRAAPRFRHPLPHQISPARRRPPGRLTAGPLPRRSGVLDRVRAIPPPGEKHRRQTPVRQTGAGHGAERSRARRPDREASGVPGLGPDHAGTRVPPACADLRGLPADRAPRDDDARARTRPGQEVRASALGPEVLGRWRLAWAFPVSPRERMAARPPRRRGGSSGREMSWISGSRTSSSGPRPGSISGINDSSRSTGGTGRERPGGDDRPLPRPRLGSRPPGDSKSDGRGPAPAPGHSSMGDGRAGGGRCRPRSSPSMSPVRAGPAGPRNRCVRLGGRSGSSGSIGRKPRAGGSSASSRNVSRSRTGSDRVPNSLSRSLDQETSRSQMSAGASGCAVRSVPDVSGRL